jgi:hypothetical protein
LGTESFVAKKQFTAEQAREIGQAIGVDWGTVPIEEFRMGGVL